MKIYDINPQECREKKVGISYSGAADRGVIHLGIIKAFIEIGVKPDQIAGTSSGSIAAASHAYNTNDFNMVNLAVSIIKKLKRSDFGLTLPQIFFHVLNQRTHLQSLGDLSGLRKILEEHLPYKTFAEAKVPLSIVTTNRLNGQEIWIEEGSVVDAIIASSSLPVVFPPLTKDGQVFVDGGITDALPLFKLAEKGCGTIYAVNLGYSGKLRKPPRNLLENLLGSLDIITYQEERYEAALIKSLYPTIKLFEIKPEVAFDIPPFAFTPERIDPIVEEAYQKAKVLIQDSLK